MGPASLRTGPRRVSLALIVFVIVTVAGLAGRLPADHPQVGAIVPAGAQRGTEVTLTIYGQRLQTCNGLVFLQPGIEVLECQGERFNRARARIRIAADCALGSHQVLVRTLFGLSALQLFMIGDRPELVEKEPNDAPGSAQTLELDVTVNGVIRSEDEDVFRIAVAQGQRINIEVEALRLGIGEFDAHLRVCDADGTELAAVDDTVFGQMDPVVTLLAERAGTWFLHLRETARGGSDASLYRLHVGTFPRPRLTFPAGGRRGSELEFRYLGDPGGASGAQLRLPATGSGVYEHFVGGPTGSSPTPVGIVYDGLDNAFEAGHDSTGSARPAPCKAGPWSVLGPFANPRDAKDRSTGHATVHPLERAGEAAFDPAASHAGRDGPIRWVERKDIAEDVVFDLRRVIGKSDDAVVYLRRSVTASSARQVLWLLSGDDTIRAFCNGRQVLDDGKPAAAIRGQHAVILDLEAGENRLLVKIANRDGGCALYSRLLDPLRLGGHRPFAAPIALNGILAAGGETDRFVFLARRGQQLDFDVVARRVRSPLDPVIAVTCTHQRFYAGNDDAPGRMDSLLRFRAPHTGEFVFTIRDLLDEGSPEHVYRVAVAPPASELPLFRTELPGQRGEWHLCVPQGGRNAILLQGRNLDRQAVIQAALLGLPQGMEVRLPPFTGNRSAVPMLVSAAPDVPLGAALAQVTATIGRNGAAAVELPGGRFEQDVETVQVRNRRTYLESRVGSLPIGVVSDPGFALELVAPTVPLIRSSPLNVAFELRRTAGFDQPVRVRMLYTPAGVTANQTTIAGGETRGSLTLNANGSASLGEHPIVLIGTATIGRGPVSVASDLATLQVATPWVTAKVGELRADRGGGGALRIEIERQQPFDGRVAAEWIGLPRGIRCEPLDIPSLPAVIEVPVVIAADAPLGRHRGFRLRLLAATSGAAVVQDFRSGEIRVDLPAPRAKTSAKTTTTTKDKDKDKDKGVTEAGPQEAPQKNGEKGAEERR